MTYARKRALTSWGFIIPYAASFAAFILVPIVVSLILSFMQFDLTNPDHIVYNATKNYSDALTDTYFVQAVQATLWYTVLLVPLLLVFSLTLAFGMNAMARGMKTVRAVLFLPAMFNVAVVSIIWQWFYEGEFGLFNFVLKRTGLPTQPWLSDKSFAMPSIVVMSLWLTLGGAAIILLAALQQIPRQITEAAILDGAGNQALISKISLPLLKPVLLFVVITNTIASFQLFGQSFLLTRGGPELSTRSVVQYIYETAFNNYRLGYGAAMSWLLFLIIAVFAFVQYRFLRRSMV